MVKRLICAVVAAQAIGVGAQQAASPLPTGALTFGAFTARFAADRTFTLEGSGWPAFTGTWSADAGQIELIVPDPPDKPKSDE